MLQNTNHPSDILNRSGFDKQYEEYKQGLQLTQCVVNIFQEKCELQSNYSRALSVLSGRLRDTVSKTTGGTVHTAWLRIAAAFEMESKLNEKFAENLVNNLIGPLKDLIETLKKDKKPLKKLVDKETENLLSQYEMEFRARQKLFSCFRNYERVYNNYVNRIDQQQQQQQKQTHVHRQQQGENNELSHNWRSLSLNRSDTVSLCTIDSTSTSTSDHDSLKNYSLGKRNSIDYHAKPVTSTSSGSVVAAVNTTKSSTLASVNGNMDSRNYLSSPTTTPVSLNCSPSRLSFLYTSLPPYRKCTKSSSFATADLKSNNTVRRHNSLSSGDVNTKKLLTVSKLKNAYNTTLTDYYRACISAEEARIDWHTRMLKCFNDQQTLESQRLDGLTKGLTVYRNTLDDILPIWKAAINELANGISLADPLLDLQNFRRRSYIDESLEMSSQQLTTNGSDSSVKSKISANVGCSLQRLIDFPCENMLLLRHHRLHEEESEEKSSSKSRAFNILRKKSQTINGKIKEGTSSTSTGLQSTSKLALALSPIPSASLRSVIQHYLTKQSMLTLLDMLAKDVEKERRTKKGLTNLVQVYAHQPAYTDMNTLMEARRRLYFSRVRLTYLTCCRQKLAHNLKQLHALETMGDSNSTGNSTLTSSDIELPLCLSQAGFSKLVLDSHISPEQSNNNTGIINSSMDHGKKSYLITSRWVHLPDLDRLPNHGGNLIEWPPFPVNDIVNEDLTDSVFQWDIENIRECLHTQNSYWILENAINNDNSLETHHETISNCTDSKLSANGHDDNNQQSSGKEFSNNQSNFTAITIKSTKDKRDGSASRSAIPEVKKSNDTTKGTLRISDTSDTNESGHGRQYTPSNRSSKQVISKGKSPDLSTAGGKQIKPTSGISTTITTNGAKNTLLLLLLLLLLIFQRIPLVGQESQL
ncbi:unnamed protein product [Trichobilharzia szidati]|nr:unnamed protein product [Trichobilharzia szidati]